MYCPGNNLTVSPSALTSIAAWIDAKGDSIEPSLESFPSSLTYQTGPVFIGPQPAPRKPTRPPSEEPSKTLEFSLTV